LGCDLRDRVCAKACGVPSKPLGGVRIGLCRVLQSLGGVDEAEAELILRQLWKQPVAFREAELDRHIVEYLYVAWRFDAGSVDNDLAVARNRKVPLHGEADVLRTQRVARSALDIFAQ